MPNHGPSEAAPGAKQLVFLAMMATVVAVIVFLCGVLVGRGTQARRGAAAVATEAATGAGIFGIGVLDVSLDPGAARGSPLDDLTYFERLSSLDPAPETLASAAVFAVQVTALHSGDEARTVEAGLVAKGYPAFVVDPVPGAPDAVYRVRVGPYADKSAADTVRRRLEADRFSVSSCSAYGIVGRFLKIFHTHPETQGMIRGVLNPSQPLSLLRGDLCSIGQNIERLGFDR